MKKIYIALGLMASVAFTSCVDLDTMPSNELADDGAVTTVNDLQNAVNGVAYSMIDRSTAPRLSYTSEYGIYADILTNVFQVGTDYGQSTSLSAYTITKNDALPEAAYSSFYRALGTVNKTLSYVPQVSGDATEIKDLTGQLYAWRALLHFDLARMFCHIPSAVSDVTAADSGLVLSNAVFDADYKGTRTTLKQTYDFIISDLTQALSLLSKDVDESALKGEFNYYGALALRARTYLYMGEYAKALADAQEVINSGVYALYERSDYASVWSKEGTSESIFEIRVNDTHNSDRNSTGYYLDSEGYAECQFNTSSNLYVYLSNSSNNDIRSSLIKDQSDDNVYDSPGYYSAKYPGRGGSIYVNNFKVFRLSEMYLIAAEASYYVSGGSAAAPFVNSLRQKRISGYTDVSTVTLADILFEYEKEFFTENQIAFAYWRNKQNVTSRTGEVIKYNEYKSILPIPQTEIDQNSGLKQNYGY